MTSHEMLTIQLKKWVNRGHVTNVTFQPSYCNSLVPTRDYVVAAITDRQSRDYVFSDSGFYFPGHGFICYEQVDKVNWISSQSDKYARKAEDFDHIELQLSDSSSMTITDIGQAVFPLLRFFQWLLTQRQAEQGAAANP